MRKEDRFWRFSLLFLMMSHILSAKITHLLPIRSRLSMAQWFGCVDNGSEGWRVLEIGVGFLTWIIILPGLFLQHNFAARIRGFDRDISSRESLEDRWRMRECVVRVTPVSSRVQSLKANCFAYAYSFHRQGFQKYPGQGSNSFTASGYWPDFPLKLEISFTDASTMKAKVPSFPFPPLIMTSPGVFHGSLLPSFVSKWNVVWPYIY